MRTPTPRGAAWSRWRERLGGADLVVTTEPECGLYRAKRGGRWTAVQIDLKQETDPDTGELVGDEAFVAWENDRHVDADAVWSFCADDPIDEDEFARIKRMPAVTDLTRQVVV